MHVTLRDGSVLAGTLHAADEPGVVMLESESLGEALQIPLMNLRRAESDLSTTGAENEFAFELNDQSRVVGKLLSWERDAIQIQSRDLGEVTLDVGEVVSVVAAPQVRRRLQSLRNADGRWQPADGWSDPKGALECAVPGSSIVGWLDLPPKFQLQLRIRCEGEPDFELALGDRLNDERSRDGAGQGGRPRVGSLAVRPSERFSTHVNWLGQSLSLVRANPSVSDTAVAGLAQAEDELRLTLFVDQTAGRMAAYRDGIQLAAVALEDEQPILHRSISLASHGDPLRVEQFDVLQWDGELPLSRRLPDRFTLGRDGNVIGQAAVAFDPESRRFRIADQWVSSENVLRMRLSLVETDVVTDDAVRAEQAEILLADQSRLVGNFLGDDDQHRIRFRWGSARTVTPITPSRLVRILGPADGGDTTSSSDHWLIADELRLRGRLIEGLAAEGGFAWRSAMFRQQVELPIERRWTIQLRERSDVPEPRSAGQKSTRDLTAGEDAPDASSLLDASVECECVELTSGDILPGQVMRIGADRVVFRNRWGGEVTIDRGQILGVSLKAQVRVQTLGLDPLLTVPRNQAGDPPTHLFVSVTGDLLRGRLLSLDDKRCQVEVRSVQRSLPREAVARILFLDPATGVDDSCRLVLRGMQGVRLGLPSATLEGQKLTAHHAVAGDLRIPLESLQSIASGPRNYRENQPETPQLRPAKQPRTFDRDPPRQETPPPTETPER
ncbi:hypothetical protein FYK55_08960 [Roseiconus nitratireducens]|uniref:Uncharacterized protein n=1 Tax=Roseiconus nitratireducens TaxID=2605748 RepID=A0A5M6DA96_9BACT|nr:hypothetical protein [Roseiconus nitratireducens]KAA5544451.1 hypothetical protein FYK55_08960 [Roseiconus nitratireducens]